MATFVTFHDMKTGDSFDVNADDPNISDVLDVPASALPNGVAAASYIVWDTGKKIAVRGARAATVAALTVSTPTVDSGTYAPVVTVASGPINALAADGPFNWMRIGKVVQVSGSVTGNVTGAGQPTIHATLPPGMVVDVSGSAGGFSAGAINVGCATADGVAGRGVGIIDVTHLLLAAIFTGAHATTQFQFTITFKIV